MDRFDAILTSRLEQAETAYREWVVKNGDDEVNKLLELLTRTIAEGAKTKNESQQLGGVFRGLRTTDRSQGGKRNKEVSGD